MRLFRFDDLWVDRPELLNVLKQIAESATKTVQKFGSYGQMPSVSFYFVNQIDTNPASAEWQKSPCNVTVFFDFDSDPEAAKQVIAHEIFHCFQSANIALPQGYHKQHSAAWWVEGSADYFSNLVYPKTNRERGDQTSYRMMTPLTQQPNPYSASLFFQYLENQGFADPLALLAELRLQPKANDPNGALEALAKWPNIATLLHEFFKAIISQAILDTDGSPAGMPSVTFGFPDYNLEPTSLALHLEARPFLPSGAVVQFAKGAKQSVTLSPEDYDLGIRVSYRKKGDAGWIALKPGASLKVESACDADRPIYDFLMSSASTRKGVIVELKQEAEAQDCACQSTTAIIDPCLTGTWEVDNEATGADLLAFFKDLESPDDAYEYTKGVMTGVGTFKIESGNFKSTHLFSHHKMMFTHRHKETGKLKEFGVDIDALATLTYRQEDHSHVCVKYEVADGTITSIMNGNSTSLDAANHLVGPFQQLTYECKGKTLKLWHDISTIGLKPYLTLKK